MHMDDNGLRRLQLVKLDMLKNLISVLERHRLSWFADGGTLLGAVRNGGFIPWDDDIDICMPRSSYNDIREIDTTEFHPYFLQWYGSDIDAARGHVQMRRSDTTEILTVEMDRRGRPRFGFNQGAFIDIFPLDSTPVERVADYGRLLAGLKKKALDSRGIARECLNAQIKFDEAVSGITDSQNVDTMAVNYCPDHFTPASCYEESLKIGFEGVSIEVPIGYECRLVHLYGPDWRTPKKLPTLHGETFVDLDHPYTHYVPMRYQG